MPSAGEVLLGVKPDLSMFGKELHKQALGVSKTAVPAMQKVGSLLTKTLTPAALGLAVGFKKAFDEWDRGADALRTGTGATGKALKGLEGSMKRVASVSTQGIGDIGEMMADLSTRTGLTGPPLEDLAQKLLQLDRIGMPLDVASITRLFGDWSVATKDQSATLDELFRLSQATGIGLDTLSQLMVQFGSPLRQLGLDFDFTAAMFARFEREGVNIQTAMPGLRMALKNFAAAGREPAPALMETFEAIRSAGSAAEANTMAFEIFGTRAGPDMAAAIREGRFNLDELMRVMNEGSDTIEKASNDTLDLSDKFAMLRNRVIAAVGPIGEFGSIIAGGVAAIGPFLLGLGMLSQHMGKLRFAALGAKLAMGGLIAALAAGAVIRVAEAFNRMRETVRQTADELRTFAGDAAATKAGLRGIADESIRWTDSFDPLGFAGKMLGLQGAVEEVTSAQQKWANANLFATDAMGQFKAVTEGATNLTNEQRTKVARIINTFSLFGGELDSSAEAQVNLWLKTGQYNRAIDLLRRALKQAQDQVRTVTKQEQEHERQLIKNREAGARTENQTRDLADAVSGYGTNLNKTKGNYKASLLLDTARAGNAASDFVREMKGMGIEVSTAFLTGAAKFHSGGPVPGAGDIPALLEGGEWVFPKNVAENMGPDLLRDITRAFAKPVKGKAALIEEYHEGGPVTKPEGVRRLAGRMRYYEETLKQLLALTSVKPYDFPDPSMFAMAAATGGLAGATPAIRQIYPATMAKFPDIINFGIKNIRPIAGTSTWSQHAYGNAWDASRPGWPGSLDPVWSWLQGAAAAGLPVNIPYSLFRKYGGGSPHLDHIHIAGKPLYGGDPYTGGYPIGAAQGGSYLAKGPTPFMAGELKPERVDVTRLDEPRTFALTITNWKDGRGYIEEVAEKGSFRKIMRAGVGS